jgi:hypothetical protein
MSGILHNSPFVTWQVLDGCLISNLCIDAQNKLTEANVQQFLNDMAQYLHTGVRFCWIIDTSNVNTKPPMSFAKTIVKFMRENRDKIQQNINRTVLIVKSPVVQILLKIVFTLQPPVSPFEVVDNREVALGTAINSVV